jgi:hypothetical protein
MTFETGSKTDFGIYIALRRPLSDYIAGLARAHIKVEQVPFYGGPAFRDNGSMYIPNPSPVNYVGGPATEVDRNWDDLIWGNA